MASIAAILNFSIVLGCDVAWRVSEHCDQVEVNHYHDCNGREAFTQIIFWKWYQDDQEYHVREWKLQDAKESIEIIRGRVVTVRFRDQTEKIDRVIIAECFKESWTQVDPERLDKETLAEGERIRFVRSKVTPVPPPPIEGEL